MLIINHLGAQLIKTEICSELSGPLPPANAPALLLAGGVGRETQTQTQIQTKPKSKPRPKPTLQPLQRLERRARVSVEVEEVEVEEVECPVAVSGSSASHPARTRGGAGPSNPSKLHQSGARERL